MTATEKAQLSGVISEMLLKTTDDLGDLLQIFDSVIFFTPIGNIALSEQTKLSTLKRFRIGLDYSPSDSFKCLIYHF